MNIEQEKREILEDALSCILATPAGYSVERCRNKIEMMHKFAKDALEEVRKM